MTTKEPEPGRRGTLRLTFRASGGELRLESYERLPTICPPSTRVRPEVGRNSGFWVELRDAAGRVRFHRILHDPLGTSVEIHEPDGTRRRVVGPPRDASFVVFLPDDPEATHVAVIGDVRVAQRDASRLPAAAELARFALPSEDGDAR